VCVRETEDLMFGGVWSNSPRFLVWNRNPSVPAPPPFVSVVPFGGRSNMLSSGTSLLQAHVVDPLDSLPIPQHFAPPANL